MNGESGLCSCRRGNLFVLAALIVSLMRVSPAAGDIVTGAGAGGGPHVKAFDGATNSEQMSFFAYPPDATQGVRVAAGDVNGDGVADIVTAPGPGAGPHVKVFSGADQSELQSFFAYNAAFTGGVFVAAGDVDGDGQADIVTGADSGTVPHVKVFSGATNLELHSFMAYSLSATPGVRVAAGDVNGDGFADIITALGELTGPHVKVFDGTNPNVELYSFDAYNRTFTGGVYVASGDLDGDGHDDIITGAGAGGGTHVRVFDGATGLESQSFFAFGGVNAEIRVGAGDVNGDGRDDIITGLGPGFQSAVRTFVLGDSGLTTFSTFSPYGAFTGGVYVAGVRIPEPSALSLTAMGVAAPVLLRRRRS